MQLREDGGWFTCIIVIVNGHVDAEHRPRLSQACTVTETEPHTSGKGVKVRVPVVPSTATVLALIGIGVTEPTVTVKVTVWPSATSLESPGKMLVAQLATVTETLPSKAVTGEAPQLKVGGVLTKVTTSKNVFDVMSTPPLAVPPLSCTVTVTVALPNTPLASVNRRLLPCRESRGVELLSSGEEPTDWWS